jgi:hypothetical protein
MHPLRGLVITTFGCENAGADNVMMVNFTYCADIWLRRPSRFPVESDNTSVTMFSACTSCMLYNQVSAVDYSINILTSNCTLFLILAVFGLTYHFNCAS